jgi:SAM-dependent methyltransferase
VSHPPNACAGPFGALYDAYIERERISGTVGRLIWGIDVRPFYASFGVIREAPAGATILDVPCGGGVALRALAPGQDVRYVAADLAESMLARVRRRAAERRLRQVEVVAADMCALPFEDAMADVGLSYSGLHCVPDPERAVHEIARCLRPGGRLVGTTFLAGGARRQRFLFELGRRRGHPMPTFSADDLCGWLSDAGIDEPAVSSESGFVVFDGIKHSAQKDGGPRTGPSV